MKFPLINSFNPERFKHLGSKNQIRTAESLLSPWFKKQQLRSGILDAGEQEKSLIKSRNWKQYLNIGSIMSIVQSSTVLHHTIQRVQNLRLAALQALQSRESKNTFFKVMFHIHEFTAKDEVMMQLPRLCFTDSAKEEVLMQHKIKFIITVLWIRFIPGWLTWAIELQNGARSNVNGKSTCRFTFLSENPTCD